MPPAPITSIPALMQALRSEDATRPRLTWYGPAGERVELSGRVLDNWVAKTANFLVDELDVGPGSKVMVDLPAHWRGICWALAGWLAGATLCFRTDGAAGGARTSAGRSEPGAAGPPDVVATDNPARSPAAGTTVAVALGALQMRWTSELPPGALDYAAEVRAHADAFFPFAAPSGADAAVGVTGTDATSGAGAAATDAAVSFAQLLDGYARPIGTPERVLLPATGLDQVLREALGVWAAGGSVVLVHPEVEVTARLAESEKITLNRS